MSTGRFGDVFAALHGGDACAVEGPAARGSTPGTPFDAADARRSLRGRRGDDDDVVRGRAYEFAGRGGAVRSASQNDGAAAVGTVPAPAPARSASAWSACFAVSAREIDAVARASDAPHALEPTRLP